MGFFAPFRYTELQCIAHKVQKGVTMGIVTGTKKNSDMELIKGYIQGKENGKRAEEACMRTIEKIASSVYNLMMVDRNLEPLKNFVTECQGDVFIAKAKYDESRSDVTTWIWRTCEYVAWRKRGNAKNLAKREISFIDLAMKKGENDNQHSLTHRELAEANQAVYANVPTRENEIVASAFLRDCLSRLPENQRKAISLVYIERYSVREAADMMNVPVSTVNNWLYRGKNKLSKMEGLAKRVLPFLYIFCCNYSQKHYYCVIKIHLEKSNHIIHNLRAECDQY